VVEPRGGRAVNTGHGPTVSARIVVATGVESNETIIIKSTPDDHLTAGPDRPVIIPRGRRVRGTNRDPTICGGIVSSAAI
jgi:hypothetical protein